LARVLADWFEKKVQACRHQLLEHGFAQFQQADVGDLGQRNLREKTCEAAHAEQQQQRHGNHPDIDAPLAKALVEQGLQQGGHQRLGR
jgi:tyrosine-protein phosphatase YwqE